VEWECSVEETLAEWIGFFKVLRVAARVVFPPVPPGRRRAANDRVPLRPILVARAEAVLSRLKGDARGASQQTG